jgi:hypothetical protein
VVPEDGAVILQDPEGDLVELRVTGYQFPDSPDPAQRYSWHVVEGRAEHAGVDWEFRFPALTCDESPLVAEWLGSVANWVDRQGVGEQPTELWFVEPDLAFAVVARAPWGNGDVWVQVTLEQEFQERPGRRPGRRTVLRIPADPRRLRAAAGEWLAEIAPFPDLSGQPRTT